MNPRRQSFIAVDISEGAFEDENECNTAIETILRQVEREHIKKHIPLCGFGVTSCSPKGTVRYTHWGRVIKPNIIPEPYHIHTVFATDAYASSDKIFREYLQKAYGEGKIRNSKILERDMFWIKELKTDLDVIRWTYYCIGQGLHIRKINKACDEEFVKKYCIDFISTAEKANRRVGATQPLFPQYSHLLPEPFYDDLHTKKPRQKPTVLKGGVDKPSSIFDSNSNGRNNENTLILPHYKPKVDDFSDFCLYQDPTSNGVLNSNIIRDINSISYDTNSLYNPFTQSTDNYYNPF